jgi:N-ethylmaleimide reductase
MRFGVNGGGQSTSANQASGATCHGLSHSVAEVVRAQQAPAEPLFQPYKLRLLTLPNRIVMAQLTRSRARQPDNVPTSLNACYYAQGASAALIVSEATQVSMQGQGYAWTPGIHSRDQIEGWRLVTEAVHDAGGRIFLQLWHVGRISHPSLQPDNMLPVAPSAITPAGNAFIENEKGEGQLVPFVRPRALQIEEMPYIVQQYARGARGARLVETPSHFATFGLHQQLGRRFGD